MNRTTSSLSSAHRSRRALVPFGVLVGWAVAASSADAAITGTVVDAQDQSPIAGARVSIQASNTEVLTDDQGAFSFPDGVGSELVIVGAMKGYFNASVTASDPAADLQIELEAVPVEDNPDYALAEPLSCGACHVEQYSQWLGSPMADAGINTWVYDTYNGLGTAGGMEGFVYLEDSVHAAEAPESECASCHQPETWIAEPFTSLGDVADPLPGALHGVSCEVCHKVADLDESKPNFPGIHPDSVVVTRPLDPGWPVEYGRLGDVDFMQADQMRASYQPQLGAALCGACHQDKNDHDLDGDFEDPGGIISEPTYLEWLDSPYGDPESPLYADCVACHMPSTGSQSACNQLPALGRPEGDVRSHEIRGTTAEYLENSVTLELTSTVVEDELQVEVTITNDQVGHSVPTGVTIRNMILVVEAVHADDQSPLTFTGEQVVHELGGVGGEPQDGYYGGQPGKLYAKIIEDAAGNSPTFFTDAVAIVSDNRIPALGADTTNYTFTSPVGGEVDIRARLIYRRSWRSLVDTKQWAEDGHGEILEDIQPPHWGHLMEEATMAATLPCPEPSCDDDTGGSEDTGEASGDGEGDQGCGCELAGARGGLPAGGLAILVTVGLLARRRRRE